MKNLVPTAEMIAAARDLSAARAYLDETRPIVKRIQSDLLAELKVADEDGNPITEPAEAYNMDDKFLVEYYARLTAAYIKAGFLESETADGRCPLLVAESAERAAMIALNKTSLAIVPEHLKPALEMLNTALKRRDLADLNLAYISQFNPVGVTVKR